MGVTVCYGIWGQGKRDREKEGRGEAHGGDKVGEREDVGAGWNKREME